MRAVMRVISGTDVTGLLLHQVRGANAKLPRGLTLKPCSKDWQVASPLNPGATP
jgi:hypothetical protein